MNVRVAVRLRRLGLLFVLLFGCSRAPTREVVLDALVRNQVVPDTEALARASMALATSCADLVKRGSPADAELTRARFRTALLAWEESAAFREGPLMESRALVRARYWPVRAQALEALVLGSEPLTSVDVEQLGADVRGMFALEWLLFDARGRSLLETSAPEGARARTLAHALAENVAAYATTARNALGDGRTLSETLQRSGQESIIRLVRAMTATVESLASNRVAPVAELHALRRLRASDVQGAASGTSTELVLAQLRGIERLYEGKNERGLRVLTRTAAPAIDDRVRTRFEKARTRLAALGQPLELAVVRDRAQVLDAFRALKELEVALQVDLASALGVSMTFTTGDGD